MKYIIIIVAVIAMIAIKLYVDEKNYQKNLHARLLREWGCPRDVEYTREQMEMIAAYYRAGKTDETIDDITWNDLDMERIFQQMNHTSCAMGQEYLYSLLRKPLFEGEALAERERLISLFTENEEKRLALQKQLAAIGKSGRFSVYNYLNRVNGLKEENSIIHILQFLAFVGGVVLCAFMPVEFGLVLAVIAVVNMVSYYRKKADMENYYQLFAYIIKMVDFSQSMSRLDIPEIKGYLEELHEEAGEFHNFCRNSWLVVGGGSMDGNIMDALMDYVRLLTHIDIIKFHSMAKEAIRLQDKLIEMFEGIGFLDSMLAIGSYRTMMEEFCVPELDDGKSYHLEAEEVYHPLISEPVPNSIHAEKSVLLTGSNASGKSTFIKTIAINAIFAQTIHTVLAKEYRGNYFRIYSSMALRDDIMSSESYYIVEIKSLKRIVDQALSGGVPVLCFIDEVLRGTNTVERIAASTEILAMLAKANALCFAATHDIELTNILQQWYDNYHFEEKVEDSDVIFDYRLRKGKAMTRNAIKLLRMIGYDEDIVEKAEQRVQGFLEEGSWQV